MAETTMTIEESFGQDIETSMPVTEKRGYTVEEVQIILNISRPSVYRLIKKNYFHAFQISRGKWRISKKSFDEWLDSGS